MSYIFGKYYSMHTVSWIELSLAIRIRICNKVSLNIFIFAKKLTMSIIYLKNVIFICFLE